MEPAPVRIGTDVSRATLGVAVGFAGPARSAPDDEAGIEAQAEDRIIVATTRILGGTLITRDKPILRYAAAGHVRARDAKRRS